MTSDPSSQPPSSPGSASAPIVGIDLGTTMSAAAIYRDDEITFIRNALGETLTPSVVAWDERAGGMVVGRTAKDILVTNPDKAAATFKRAMGLDSKLKIGRKTYTPVELSAYVLDALRADTEAQLGMQVDRCVVTVPAYFGEAQRHATKQAAEMVGFRVERVLNEPTAAAIAYGLHKGDAEQEFVVLDLGGGTFDVCVMELFEGLLEVKGVAGVSQLGGEDFTLALRDLAFKMAGIDARRLGPRALTLALKRAELLKRRLVRWPASEIQIPTGATDEFVNVQISCVDANDAYRPLLDRMVAPCRQALRGADVRMEDLHAVVLVGGATRLPCFAELAQELFGREPQVQDDPDHLVAKGAAIQAALCAADASVGDMVVTDVASHSLGIGVVREVHGRYREGFFSPIISRNTTIPISQTESFSTVERDQREIAVEVFEGESRKVADNRMLGSFEVTNIPKGEPREVIEVRFTYDLSGILEVEATVTETGKRIAKIFDRGTSQLNDAQLQEAKAEIARLKADPKERPRHRDLLTRANGLWSELSVRSREQLSGGIDDFENALAGRNPQEIERAFATLSELCQSGDQGERW